MAQVLRFFPRQTVAGNATIYSEIYDLTGFAELTLSLNNFGGTATGGVTGTVETSSDPTFQGSNWQDVSGLAAVSGDTGRATFTSGLLQFVRTRLDIPTNVTQIVQVDGVARESS